MDLKFLKTQGIYFYQSDARINGYYTTDEQGNFKKNKYEVSLKDKLEFLFTGKNRNEPISTSFICFNIYNNELTVKSGNMTGDAVSAAKEVKRSFSSYKTIPFEVSENLLILSYGDQTEELIFNENGENISRKIIYNNFEVKTVKSYAFLNWYKV